MKKRIYLSPPHMNGKELKLVQSAFKSNWIAPVGPDINAFEKEMCEYTGAKASVALSSGTAALHLALLISGISAKDEVFCSSFTFAGSAFPVLYVGATPVFIDSEKQSWNMDPQLFEEAVKDRIKRKKKPKAAIVVHLYGQSADLDPLMEICKKYGILLIEDAAESLGATYKGKHTGTLAPLGVYSFNGNKIITTSGGGMLVGHNQKQIELARFYSTQARDKASYYEHSHIGYNYRMSNIAAAIGRGQLKTIEERVRKKRKIFEFYKKNLSSIPGIDFIPYAGYGRSNHWLTCIILNPKNTNISPEEIRQYLEKQNIESRPLWKPMHLQPIFKNYPSYENGVSENLFKNGLCLPSGTSLSDDDLERIVGCIKKAFREIP